jgi:hypothetical protein
VLGKCDVDVSLAQDADRVRGEGGRQLRVGVQILAELRNGGKRA